MKKIYFIILLCSVICKTNAQDSTIQNINDLKSKLTVFSAFLDKEKYKEVADLILNDPKLYNDIWNKVYNSLRNKENQPVLKNLKLQFKTFQASDSNKSSLGFAYDWNYDINRKKNSDYERSGLEVRLRTNGNIAFKKEVNPINFQEGKFIMGKYAFFRWRC